MTFTPGQTGIIVPVWEAEPVVSDWRERFDPSAILGIPAHVTVVFPFVPLDGLHVTDIAELKGLVAEVPRFRARFSRCARFPSVLYVAPDDEAPFRALTTSVAAHWPEAAPYGGEFGPDPIPHLTVTNQASEADSARAETAVAAQLPFTAQIDEAWMVEFDGFRWRRQATLPLG